MFSTLLIFVFIRPFISSLAFAYTNFIYATVLLIFFSAWFIYSGISKKLIFKLKYPLLLFALALIISLTFSSHKINSSKEIYKYITGLFLFFTAASLSSDKKIRLLSTIILAGFFISILAIYQYFFGFKHLLDYIAKLNISNAFALDYISRRRVFFPFVTPNTLGGYLAFIIPLTLIIKDKKKWIILSLISFALILTKSLGGFFSLFLGFVVYFWLQAKLNKGRLLFLLGLLIIIGAILIIRSYTPKEHHRPIFSTVMRLNYWRDTLGIIKAYPLTGVGLGNFNLMPSRYAHNSFLQLWAEMGILGIISILWLISAVFKSAFINIKGSPEKNQILSLISANVVFLAHNLIDFSFFLPEIAFLWWLILGLTFFPRPGLDSGRGVLTLEYAARYP